MSTERVSKTAQRSHSHRYGVVKGEILCTSLLLCQFCWLDDIVIHKLLYHILRHAYVLQMIGIL